MIKSSGNGAMDLSLDRDIERKGGGGKNAQQESKPLGNQGESRKGI